MSKNVKETKKVVGVTWQEALALQYEWEMQRTGESPVSFSLHPARIKMWLENGTSIMDIIAVTDRGWVYYGIRDRQNRVVFMGEYPIAPNDECSNFLELVNDFIEKHTEE